MGQLGSGIFWTLTRGLLRLTHLCFSRGNSQAKRLPRVFSLCKSYPRFPPIFISMQKSWCGEGAAFYTAPLRPVKSRNGYFHWAGKGSFTLLGDSKLQSWDPKLPNNVNIWVKCPKCNLSKSDPLKITSQATGTEKQQRIVFARRTLQTVSRTVNTDERKRALKELNAIFLEAWLVPTCKSWTSDRLWCHPSFLHVSLGCRRSSEPRTFP